MSTYELEFYEDERGEKPVLRWIRRKAAGLTQRQLAAKSSIQQADISRIEAGDANPTLATIAALAYALGAELALERTRQRKAAPRKRVRTQSSVGRRLSGRAAARRTR